MLCELKNTFFLVGEENLGLVRQQSSLHSATGEHHFPLLLSADTTECKGVPVKTLGL